jgi:hypothetical protein
MIKSRQNNCLDFILETWAMPKPYKPELEAVSLNISEIEYQTFTWKVPGTKVTGQKWAGLIVFSGFYRRGSMGKPDARFIRWRIDEFIDYVRNIDGLVVDLRKLDYTSGDDLDIPILRIPVLVVIPSEAEDPKHYQALKWAVGEESLQPDTLEALAEDPEHYQALKWAVGGERFRTNILEAFGEMSELIVNKKKK